MRQNKEEYKELVSTRKLVTDIATQKKRTVNAVDVFAFVTGFHFERHHSSFR